MKFFFDDINIHKLVLLKQTQVVLNQPILTKICKVKLICTLPTDWEVGMGVSENSGTPKSSILIGFSSFPL